MDWSDDVSYSVHDFEDALVAHQVEVKNFYRDLPQLHKVMLSEYGVSATEEEAKEALERLGNLTCWPSEFDGTHKALARLKDLTSQLIGRFVLTAEIETRKVQEPAH